MKKIVITLVAFALLAGTSCKHKIDILKEKEAIKTIIEQERDAFINRDLDLVNATWLQESYSRKVDICKYCGIVEYVGWDEIINVNREFFESSPRKSELVYDYSKNDINIIENTALVYFDVTISGKYMGEDLNLKDKRIIHLRKTDGKWKMDMYVHYTLPDEESETEEL